MTAKNESLAEGQIANLARKLFGPEEAWDDAQAEFLECGFPNEHP